MKGLGLYWGVTGLFGIAMLGAGAFELSHPPDLIATMDRLGYPHYALTLIGIAKIAGAVLILVPFTRPLEGVGFCRLRSGFLRSDHVARDRWRQRRADGARGIRRDVLRSGLLRLEDPRATRDALARLGG